jgi:hypothetical protein
MLDQREENKTVVGKMHNEKPAGYGQCLNVPTKKRYVAQM